MQKGEAEEVYSILERYVDWAKGIHPRPTDHIERDLAFDSLDRVWLEGFLDMTFGTRINAASLGDYPTLHDLALHVSRTKTRMEVHKVDWHELLSSPPAPPELPRSTVLYPLAAKLLRLWLGFYHRLRVEGLSNIPKHTPCILAPNHQSYLDGAAVVAGLGWKALRRLYFYATEEHVSTPLLRFVARHSNIVLMERNYLRLSIGKLAEVLREGGSVVIFPEGTRSRTGAVGPFKKTFAILAQELRVPIVPVCLGGAYEAWPRNHVLASPLPIRVSYLPQVMPSDHTTCEELTTLTREAIVERLAGVHKEA